jgi:ABC-type methionine transport system permease subunit
MTALATSTPWNEVWDLLGPATWETVQMVAWVLVIALLLGTPLAILLHNSSHDGLFPAPRVHAVAGWIVNLGRSLPFLILMTAIIPLTRLITGTTIGVTGAIVPLSLGATPYYARLVESTLREVPREVVEIALAGGASRWQIIRKVQLPESVPGIISNLTIAIVAMVEYTAIAGAIGAGGIGGLALNYGYNRFDTNIMIATVVALVLFVQVIQFGGDRISRATRR